MEKIKSKKVIMGTKLFLAGILAMGLFAIAGCGDDSKEDHNDWYEVWGDTGIKFYQETGVTGTQMDDMIDEFKNAYAGWGGGQAAFAKNVTEIHITASLPDGTNPVTHNGKVLYVIFDADMNTEIGPYLSANNFFAQIKQKDDIMLAKYNHLKKQVLAQMKKIEAENVKA